MKKLFFQLLTMLALFFATWFALSQINWVNLLNVEKTASETEEKLGDLLWEMIEDSEEKVHSKTAREAVDRLLERICTENGIDREKIKVHLIRKDEINAFVLPNNHLVIYSGLIAESLNEAEFAGVLCHEIAHIEHNHVMKKLAKELGLSVLVSMTGGSGGEALREALRTLSSSAYDRSLESEADKAAIGYLINARIDPAPLADFLYRMAQETSTVPKQLYWISTHPDSEERAQEILKEIKGKTLKKEPVLSAESWESLKNEVNANPVF